jgi:hypothetical protein
VIGKQACELRLGRWQTALFGLEVDTLITDPPFSERTHAGMRVGAVKTGAGNARTREGVVYSSWTAADADAFVRAWAPRTRGWLVLITDHWLAPVMQRAATACGRYAFAPLPFVELGKQPRLSGDGPASWTCWIAASRPATREYARWGSLRGAYVTDSKARTREIKGGKPEWLMRALVRDYSRPGGLVCDPCAGAGTTLVAARAEGRRVVGAERDPATYALATERLARPWSRNLFGDTGTQA